MAIDGDSLSMTIPVQPDGMEHLNNTNAPPEVYAYYIELIIEGCDGVQKKGNVTLIR